MWLRVVLLVGGILLLIPNYMLSLIGAAVGGIGIAYGCLKSGRQDVL